MKALKIYLTVLYLGIITLASTAEAQTIEQDSLALVALYNNCGGSAWEGFESWLSEPIANWKDVTVSDVEGLPRVTHLNWYAMPLSGTLPAELGNLTEMSGKIEMHNQPGLTGELPAAIWNWTKVERLQIKWCGFSSIDTTGLHKMVNLYEFNTQATPFEGEIPVGFFKLPLMSDMYLEDGKWSSLPSDMPIPTAKPLRRFYLNGNQFTDLPDLSGMVWAEGAKIKIRNNYLTFEDIVPNMWIASDAKVSAFEYAPQETIGEPETKFVASGTPVTLMSGIGGSGTVYNWVLGEDVVNNDMDYAIAAFDPSTQSGTYYCVGQNASVPNLDIYTAPVQIYESALAMDSLALVALYNNCGGASWEGFESWLSEPIANWKDVTVSDVEGLPRVTHLNWYAMPLSGTLPAELGNLTEMSGKIEMHNQPGLTGELPAAIWNWTKVERLQIKWCGFSSIDTTGLHKMVNLYEFNTQATPFEGEIPVGFFKLPLMSDMYLEDGKWSSLPSDMPIPTAKPLRRFYLNGNQFTDLPDLSGMVWAEGAKIKVKDNYLTFEDLEPNMWIASDAKVSAFEISPQALVADKQTFDVAGGTEVKMKVEVGGSANTYTWAKAGEPISGEDKDSLVIANAALTNAGSYVCYIQNTSVPGLTLSSDTFTVIVDGQTPLTTTERVDYKLYGNPVKDILKISLSAESKSVTIFDLSGRVVAMFQPENKVIEYNMNHVKTGTYLVIIKTEGERILSIPISKL